MENREFEHLNFLITPHIPEKDSWYNGIRNNGNEENFMGLNSHLKHICFRALDSMGIPKDESNGSFSMKITDIIQLHHIINTVVHIEKSPFLPFHSLPRDYERKNLPSAGKKHLKKRDQIGPVQLQKKLSIDSISEMKQEPQEDGISLSNKSTEGTNNEEANNSPSNRSTKKTQKFESYLVESKLTSASLKLYQSESSGNLVVSPNKEGISLITSIEINYIESDVQGKRPSKFPCTKITASFVKNFPKKVGDLFANFLNSLKLTGASKVFKDKTSWKLLNKYLGGEKSPEGVSTKSLIKLFLEFLRELTVEKIAESKVQDESLRQCYKLLLEFLKEGCSVLEKQNLTGKICCFEVRKTWPSLELNFKWDE